MSTSTDPFVQLNDQASDPQGMLATLVKVYRHQQMPHELFEARKMQIRARLGLSVLPDDGSKQPAEDVERQLEHGLLDACREVGAMLLRAGRVRDGWTYFRPTGDTQAAAGLIRQIAVTDDNSDEIISVCLHEGVDIEYGYGLLLERMGTCNSITTFDQVLANRHYRDQRLAAALLLDHVYRELAGSLAIDIERREGTMPTSTSIAELIQERPQLFEGGAYHLDTTHLSATIRICRVLEQAEQIERINHLIAYGRKLNPQYQYPGEEPFSDFYQANALFFGALQQRGVDQALRYFRDKATQLDALEHGTQPIEVYVDLLDRLGKHDQALAAAIELIPADVPAPRVAPLLLELAQKASSYQPVLDFARRRGDLLLYAAALSEGAPREAGSATGPGPQQA